MGTWVRSIAAVYAEKLWSWMEPAEYGAIFNYLAYLLKPLLLSLDLLK